MTSEEMATEGQVHDLTSLLAQGAVKDIVIIVHDGHFNFDWRDIASDNRMYRNDISDSDEAAGVIRALISTSPSQLQSLSIITSGDNVSSVLGVEELSEIFKAIASTSWPSLTHLRLWLEGRPLAPHQATAPAATTLSQALERNRSIQSLKILVSHCMYMYEVDGSAPDGFLSPWAGLRSSLRNPHCSIRSLRLDFDITRLDDVLRLAMERDLSALAAPLLAENQSIKELYLFNLMGSSSSKLSVEVALVLLEKNSTLTTLELLDFDLSAVGGFDRIFKSLASNTSLTSFSLRSCEGPFTLASVLDSLQANGRISQVDLKDTPLEGIAAIEAQLKRNRKNAEQMDALHKSSKTVSPTRCRLFLCGRPYAGKSTLAKSMKEACERKTAGSMCTTTSLSKLCGRQLARTRGIEMSSIQKDGITVSIWDMAGQLEYYTIHDFMFPDLSDRRSPSFFMFVWNPMREAEDALENPAYKTDEDYKTAEDFQRDLTYWLKFIISKTRRSNVFKPFLLIVITRNDKCIRDGSWISRSLNSIRIQFEQYVEFWDRHFNVDAREPSSVSALTSYVFEIAQNVLESAGRVLEICEEVRGSISRRLARKAIPPLLPQQKFRSECTHLFREASEDEVEAIALTLNDSGDIIYLKSVDLVAVDTHWFSHTVMGELIHMKEEIAKGIVQKPGFVTMKRLESLLQDLAARQEEPKTVLCKPFRKRADRVPQPHLVGKELVKLLQGLHLACLEEEHGEDPIIFVPAILLAAPDAQSSVRWRRMDGQQFLGRRFRCRDADHTFLTPGIFPLVQVKFHSFLFHGKSVELQTRAVGFISDGVEVWVELVEDENGYGCIDVLARSVNYHDADLLKWVEKRVIREIRSVCASDRGIQGVELEQLVIRPSCVQGPNAGQRRNQCVRVEDLRKILEEKLGTESLADSCKKAGFDWPAGDGLGVEWSSVIDLLGKTAALEVCKPYVEKWNVAAEEMFEQPQVRRERRDSGFIDGAALGEDWPAAADQEADQQIMAHAERTDFEYESEAQAEMHRDIKKISRVQAEMHRDIKKISRVVNDTNVKVTNIQERIEEIIKKADSSRDQVLKRLSEVLTFLEEGEGSRLPWMFVVTAATGVDGVRMMTALVPGARDWKIQLLCEHPFGKPHLPREQPTGLQIVTLDDGFVKTVLPYLSTFLKCASVALKIGARVTVKVATGVDFTIPDFSEVLKLPMLNDRAPPLTSTASHTSRASVRDAQGWLRNVLCKHKCESREEIYKMFKLQPVWMSNSRVAWVCDEHGSVSKPC